MTDILKPIHGSLKLLTWFRTHEGFLALLLANTNATESALQRAVSPLFNSPISDIMIAQLLLLQPGHAYEDERKYTWKQILLQKPVGKKSEDIFLLLLFLQH